MEELELLRVSDIAARLRLTSGRVYQLIQAGDVPAVRVGGAIRVPSGAFQEWLRAQDVRARSKQRHEEAGRVSRS